MLAVASLVHMYWRMMESFHSKEDSYSAVLACRHIRLILQKGMAARVTIWPVYDLLRRVIGYAMCRWNTPKLYTIAVYRYTIHL